MRFRNPELPLTERIRDLMAGLSLEEKVSQLLHDAPSIERLGIDAHSWWNEGLHGVARSGAATVFPQAIGMAASFDRELLLKVAAAVAEEARAKYELRKKRGQGGRYSGLTFWTPNINIFRDPRWGRGQETYGEDPFLTGELGAAFFRGLQGGTEGVLKTAACAKHFAVHSGPEKERHHFNAEVSAYDLEDTYLPAFRRLVEEGVEAVMGAYNRVNGEASCGSDFLLRKTLREGWGFKGHVVSDCWAIQDFHTDHGVTETAAESAALALNSGCDLNCGCIYEHLLEALEKGLVTEEVIDTSLSRLLATRFRLGEFDPPGYHPFQSVSPFVIRRPEHIELSYRAAVNSAVLLKNEGILPLNRDTLASLFITGPNALSPEALLGTYYGLSPRMITPLEGIVEAAGPEVKIDFRHGSLLSHEKENDYDWAVFDAREADVVIACMGLNILIEGEEGDAIASPEMGDRKDLRLPRPQHDFLMKLLQIDKPVILVVNAGSPVDLSPYLAQAAAVVYHWYPGEQGGLALGRLLFGEEEFSGKLPVTFPSGTEVLPPFEDYSMEGRTYRYMAEENILFPFGFGLSSRPLRPVRIETAEEISAATEELKVVVTVRNPLEEPASDVVQLYGRKEAGQVRSPERELLGFFRVTLEAGEERRIVFAVNRRQLSCLSNDGDRRFRSGRLLLWAGTNPPGPAATRQGGGEPLTAEVLMYE